MGRVSLVPDVVDQLQRAGDVHPHGIRLQCCVLKRHQELVHLRKRLPNRRDSLSGDVLENAKCRFRKPPALHLLGSVVTEVKAPLGFHVRVQELIHQPLRDARREEALPNLIKIHL
jgi:hypothetical protein